MGKNIHGGAGHKKFAHKHNSTCGNNTSLKLSTNEYEIYAIVMKMLGNGMFHCHCIDGVVRLGHIRKKFSRGKRHNMVEIGKWVLIGLRSWDTTTPSDTKIQHCDLMEIYTDTDKQRLKDTVKASWNVLEQNNVNAKASAKPVDDIVFGDTDEHDRLIREMKSSTAQKISLTTNNDTDNVTEEIINFDDI